MEIKFFYSILCIKQGRIKFKKRVPLSKEDVKSLSETIDYDPSDSVSNKGDVSTQALPALLVPIAQYIGGAAGAVIIAEVTLYGTAKACENLEGDYGFFDDFWETRGYI